MDAQALEVVLQACIGARNVSLRNHQRSCEYAGIVRSIQVDKNFQITIRLREADCGNSPDLVGRDEDLVTLKWDAVDLVHHCVETHDGYELRDVWGLHGIVFSKE